MKHLGTTLCLGCVLSAVPLARAADSVTGTRGPDQVKDTVHTADIQLHPGWAKIVVRRTVHNSGARTDQAILRIETPPGAAAVGLRSQGLRGAQTIWFEGDLLDRDVAERRYRELTGFGHAIPKDPALLYWVGLSRLGLQVFPIASGESKTVEYTLLAPIVYGEGRYRLNLEPMQSPALSATATVHAEPGDALFLGELRSESGATLSLDRAAQVSFARARAPRLAGSLAAVPASSGRALWSYRVEAAPRLSKVPRQAAVVVLIDESRSLDLSVIEDQRALARVYLSHFPAARVGLVRFDRVARPVSTKLSSARDALARLARERVQPRNGSHLDVGLAEAAALLAQAPASAERRVLVLTDTLTRERLTQERLRAAFAGTSALVHVATVNKAGSCNLERDDEHPWAWVTRRTKGLVWKASTDGCADGDSAEPHARTASNVIEELARPVRIHHLRLLVSGLDLRALQDAAFEVPDMLSEGEGVQDLRVVPGTPTGLAVEGELWTSPIRLALTPSEREGRVAAALAFGNTLLYDLSAEEQRTLAFHGHAVSPVTSYLAIEPGVRPSTEGLLTAEMSGVGHGYGSGHGTVRGSAIGHPGNPAAWLSAELGDAWKRCGGAGQVSIDVETTLDEVVDVLRATAKERADEAHLDCLAEAAWKLDLPSMFSDEHNTYAVSL